MIRCIITPSVQLTCTITRTTHLTVCAPQRVQPPAIVGAACCEGASSAHAAGVCVRAGTVLATGVSQVRAAGVITRAGAEVAGGWSVVRAVGERIAYPMRLPGAYAFYNARDLAIEVGRGVERWPDRINGLDALTGPNYIPMMGMKEGMPCVSFNGAQWMFAGEAMDWYFLSEITWTIATCFWIDLEAKPSWQAILGTGINISSGGRSIQTQPSAASSGLTKFYSTGGGSTGNTAWQIPTDTALHTIVIAANGDGTWSFFGDGEHKATSQMDSNELRSAALHLGHASYSGYAMVGGIASAYIGTQPITAQQAAGYHQWALGE